MSDKLREALVVASHAIEQAVLCEDGLDGAEAERVLHRIGIALDAPPSTNPDTVRLSQLVEELKRAAPPDTSVDGEPTDEMVRAALTIETDEGGPISQDIGFGMMRLMLRAALAVRPKGEG